MATKKPKETSKDKIGDTSALGHTRDKDGIDHINTHPTALTQLGKDLSHFQHKPFTHPYFGNFYSIEGFWYFMRSIKKDDRLRYLSGRRAKQVGKDLPYQWYPNFKEDILAASYQKIIQHEDIRLAMIESTLPFDNYYLFKSVDDPKEAPSVHTTPQPSHWLVQGLEDIRKALKAGVIPDVWIKAEKRYMKN